MKQKLMHGKKIEFAVLGLFVISYCVISAFHEPWYDEALSWQIGKCASLKDILFTLPPYEGHPPLWHLLLAIPAKAGIPFEVGLKSIGLVICTISAGVMLFRSNLPRCARLIIPFTYFFFYQYGIVVRPYCLMLLSLLLLGIFLPERILHPWKVFALLCFLCFTSAYGILMAGGIAICILWELWREKGTAGIFREIISDPRELSLLVLLAVALVLIIEFFPAADGYSVSIKGNNPYWLCIICALFSFPLNCFFLSSSWFRIEQLSIQTMSINTIEMVSCCVLGLMFWFLIICVTSKRQLKFLIVPYLMYSVFAAVVYFSTHHIGVVFILFLFWAELMSRDENRFEVGRVLLKKLAETRKDRLILKKAFITVCCFGIAIPLYWCVSASIHEIEYNYCFARTCAEFLRSNALDDGLILCDWNFQGDKYSVPEGHEDYINTYIVDSAVVVTAYFPHNICLNLNNGEDNFAYVLHKVPDYNESRAVVESWREKGPPDIIIGHPTLKYVYGNDISYSDYSLVANIESGFIWKDMRSIQKKQIFLRKDLLNQYELKQIDSTDQLW